MADILKPLDVEDIQTATYYLTLFTYQNSKLWNVGYGLHKSKNDALEAVASYSGVDMIKVLSVELPIQKDEMTIQSCKDSIAWYEEKLKELSK